MMLARAQIAVVAVLVPAIMCMRVAKVPRVPPAPLQLPLPNGAAGPRDVHVRHTTPEEYGAKGDGVSNDWGPILAAVGSCKGYTTCTVTFAQHYLSGPIQVWQWRPAWLLLTGRTPHGVSRVLADCWVLGAGCWVCVGRVSAVRWRCAGRAYWPCDAGVPALRRPLPTAMPTPPVLIVRWPFADGPI